MVKRGPMVALLIVLLIILTSFVCMFFMLEPALEFNAQKAKEMLTAHNNEFDNIIDFCLELDVERTTLYIVNDEAQTKKDEPEPLPILAKDSIKNLSDCGLKTIDISSNCCVFVFEYNMSESRGLMWCCGEPTLEQSQFEEAFVTAIDSMDNWYYYVHKSLD